MNLHHTRIGFLQEDMKTFNSPMKDSKNDSETISVDSTYD